MDLKIDSQFGFDFNNESVYGIKDNLFVNDLEAYFPEEDIKNDFYNLIMSPADDWVEPTSEVSSDSGFDYCSVKQELNSPPYDSPSLDLFNLNQGEIPEFDLNALMNFSGNNVTKFNSDFSSQNQFDDHPQRTLNTPDIKSEINSLNLSNNGFRCTGDTESELHSFELVNDRFEDTKSEINSFDLLSEDMKSDYGSVSLVGSDFLDFQNRDIGSDYLAGSDLLAGCNVADTVENILSKPVKVLVLPSDKKKIPLGVQKPVKYVTKSTTIPSFTTSPGLLNSKSVTLLTPTAHKLPSHVTFTSGSAANFISNYNGAKLSFVANNISSGTKLSFVANSVANNGTTCMSNGAGGQSVKIIIPRYQGTATDVPNKKQKIEVEKLVNSKVLILPKSGTSTSESIYEYETKLPSTPNSSDSESNSKFSPISTGSSEYSNGKDPTHINEVMKRQQKMIKNRESASLSRKRKKEYVSTLEEQIHNIECENEKLRKENILLKNQISKLQKENSFLKVGKPLVKASALLSICLLVSFNYNGLMGWFRPQDGNSLLLPISGGHIGRKLQSLEFSEVQPHDQMKDLLKLNNSTGGLNTSSLAELNRRFDEHNLKLVKQISDKLMCANHFNTTESLRLMDELRGWVNGHEASLKIQANVKRAYPYAGNIPAQKFKITRDPQIEKSPLRKKKKVPTATLR